MKFPIIYAKTTQQCLKEIGMEDFDRFTGLVYWKDSKQFFLYQVGVDGVITSKNSPTFWKDVLKFYHERGYTEGKKEIWTLMLGKTE